MTALLFRKICQLLKIVDKMVNKKNILKIVIWKVKFKSTGRFRQTFVSLLTQIYMNLTFWAYPLT